MRTPGGRVLCPPLEYDPDSGETNDPTLIDVGPGGTVTSYTWVSDPLPQHPLDRPFAFALIKIDGADTEMFHAVDAGSEAAITRGTRVLPQWREEVRGRIDDLAYFVPEASAPPDSYGPIPKQGGEPIKTMEHWVSLTYNEAVAPAAERYAEALLQGKIIGQKCPTCGRTYIPPRDGCTVDGIPVDPSNDVELPDLGVITNYTVVIAGAVPRPAGDRAVRSRFGAAGRRRGVARTCSRSSASGRRGCPPGYPGARRSGCPRASATSPSSAPAAGARSTAASTAGSRPANPMPRTSTSDG